MVTLDLSLSLILMLMMRTYHKLWLKKAERVPLSNNWKMLRKSNTRKSRKSSSSNNWKMLRKSNTRTLSKKLWMGELWWLLFPWLDPSTISSGSVTWKQLQTQVTSHHKASISFRQQLRILQGIIVISKIQIILAILIKGQLRWKGISWNTISSVE